MDSWPVQSTSAVAITECIFAEFSFVSLESCNIVAAVFHGTSNLSDKRDDVQALLRSEHQI